MTVGTDVTVGTHVWGGSEGQQTLGDGLERALGRESFAVALAKADMLAHSGIREVKRGLICGDRTWANFEEFD